MADRPQERHHPWPLRQVKDRLCSGDVLKKLCGPKATTSKHDVRETTLEALAATVMATHFGSQRVTVRRPIGTTLGISNAPFPGQALPDIVVNLDDGYYICELKSSRTDYNRFDNVFDGRIKAYLASIGHDGSAPWEVEQDLIKLRLFHGLSSQVRSCLFMMVDAYAGPGRSWANVFADPDVFAATMRTELVRGYAPEVRATTTIEPISAGSVAAKIIVCELRPTSG